MYNPQGFNIDYTNLYTLLGGIRADFLEFSNNILTNKDEYGDEDQFLVIAGLLWLQLPKICFFLDPITLTSPRSIPRHTVITVAGRSAFLPRRDSSWGDVASVFQGLGRSIAQPLRPR